MGRGSGRWHVAGEGQGSVGRSSGRTEIEAGQVAIGSGRDGNKVWGGMSMNSAGRQEGTLGQVVGWGWGRWWVGEKGEGEGSSMAGQHRLLVRQCLSTCPFHRLSIVINRKAWGNRHLQFGMGKFWFR